MGSTGTVSDRYAYDPYGNVTASSGTVANPWQFAGGYYDASTGVNADRNLERAPAENGNTSVRSYLAA